MALDIVHEHYRSRSYRLQDRDSPVLSLLGWQGHGQRTTSLASPIHRAEAALAGTCRAAGRGLLPRREGVGPRRNLSGRRSSDSHLSGTPVAYRPHEDLGGRWDDQLVKLIVECSEVHHGHYWGRWLSYRQRLAARNLRVPVCTHSPERMNSRGAERIGKEGPQRVSLGNSCSYGRRIAYPCGPFARVERDSWMHVRQSILTK